MVHHLFFDHKLRSSSEPHPNLRLSLPRALIICAFELLVEVAKDTFSICQNWNVMATYSHSLSLIEWAFVSPYRSASRCFHETLQLSHLDARKCVWKSMTFNPSKVKIDQFLLYKSYVDSLTFLHSNGSQTTANK
jgi:hypothetical protein